MKKKYPPVDHLNFELTDWQKELIDIRLTVMRANPERIRPVKELLEELNCSEELS